MDDDLLMSELIGDLEAARKECDELREELERSRAMTRVAREEADTLRRDLARLREGAGMATGGGKVSQETTGESVLSLLGEIERLRERESDLLHDLKLIGETATQSALMAATSEAELSRLRAELAAREGALVAGYITRLDNAARRRREVLHVYATLESWREAVRECAGNYGCAGEVSSIEYHAGPIPEPAEPMQKPSPFGDPNACPQCGNGSWIETTPEICTACGYRRPEPAKPGGGE